MHETWMLAVTYFTLARARAKALADDEAGFSTLEWIVIGLGVFTAAGLAVAVIANAITSRTSQIN